MQGRLIFNAGWIAKRKSLIHKADNGICSPNWDSYFATVLKFCAHRENLVEATK